MSLYPDLDRLDLNQLIVRFTGPPEDGEEYACTYYTEVALHIRERGGDAGVNYLWNSFERADTDRQRAIIFALSEPSIAMPALKERLLSLLHDARPMVVMESVDGLARLGAADATDRVIDLQQHPSPYVRGSVLRFMRRIHPDRAFPLLIKAIEDPHALVREVAADELGELQNLDAIPHLRPLLVDPDSDVRQAAQTAIEILESMPRELKEDAEKP